MNDRVSCIAMLLGLAWLVAGAFYLLGFVPNVLIKSRDSIQIASLAATLLTSIAALGIWRHYVHWTGRRVTSTAALTILMVAQVIIWRPLWSSTACAVEDHLRFGQSSSLLGLWWAVCCLLWWGSILASGQSSSYPKSEGGTRRMTPDAVRLSIGLALIPFLTGLFFFLLGAMEILAIGFSSEWQIWLCFESCAFVAAVVWYLLWRKRVKWNRRTVHLTTVLLILLFLSASAMWLPGGGFSTDAIRGALPFFGAAFWFGGTALLWRRADAAILEDGPTEEQLLQVVCCADCGYSLRGLGGVRCPECGWISTVDDAVRRGVLQMMELQDKLT